MNDFLLFLKEGVVADDASILEPSDSWDTFVDVMGVDDGNSSFSCIVVNFEDNGPSDLRDLFNDFKDNRPSDLRDVVADVVGTIGGSSSTEVLNSSFSFAVCIEDFKDDRSTRFRLRVDGREDTL